MFLKFSAMARRRLRFAARAGALGFGSLPILTPGCTPGCQSFRQVPAGLL